MYYKIENYTMKCRLYLNETQKEQVDKILTGIRIAHNCAIYDAVTNGVNTKERTYKNKDGEDSCVHYVDARSMSKSDYLEKLRSEHDIINEVPAGALSGNNGLFLNDISKKFKDVERKKNISLEYAKSNDKIHYYSNKNPRRSYSYQEEVTKFIFGENENVFYMNLSKLGKVKIRGWNKNLRFTNSCELNFIEYIAYQQEIVRNSKKNGGKRKSISVTITIKKDNCNDYWICFKLADVYIWKKDLSGNEVGCDVGVKDILITSDEKKYKNKKFKKHEKKHIKALNRRLSRRQGWANEEFREAMKGKSDVKTSKRYEKTKIKLAKLHRDIARKRENHNNEITMEIVKDNSFIAVESLNVKGMFRNRHLAYALSDAGMYDILNKIEYKSGWYGREVKSIDQWKPSTKRCNVCGYIKKNMTLSVREWECPECKTYHDRDVNAAKNILMYAKEA